MVNQKPSRRAFVTEVPVCGKIFVVVPSWSHAKLDISTNGVRFSWHLEVHVERRRLGRFDR
jgi:hypothetical protein